MRELIQKKINLVSRKKVGWGPGNEASYLYGNC